MDWSWRVFCGILPIVRSWALYSEWQPHWGQWGPNTLRSEGYQRQWACCFLKIVHPLLPELRTFTADRQRKWSISFSFSDFYHCDKMPEHLKDTKKKLFRLMVLKKEWGNSPKWQWFVGTNVCQGWMKQWLSVLSCWVPRSDWKCSERKKLVNWSSEQPQLQSSSSKMTEVYLWSFFWLWIIQVNLNFKIRTWVRKEFSDFLFSVCGYSWDTVSADWWFAELTFYSCILLVPELMLQRL